MSDWYYELTVSTMLDDDMPPALASALVRFITTEHRDPKWILLGHQEMRQLRAVTDCRMYVLAKERGANLQFRGIDVLEVCRESFLDVC